MPGPNKNRLLVEGDEDKRVVPQLIEALGIPWGETRREAIVDIESYGGIRSLLREQVISTELKASNRSALGIMIDANEDPVRRWQRFREVCLKIVPDLPQGLPEEGLIHRCPSGIRLGLWLMPDNRRRGMLETFLSVLVPEGQEPLWDWTEKACDKARRLGATFKASHVDKARMHAWLAFQDPPGRPFHNAIMERVLAPRSQSAQPFFDWFCRLFQIKPATDRGR